MLVTRRHAVRYLQQWRVSQARIASLAMTLVVAMTIVASRPALAADVTDTLAGSSTAPTINCVEHPLDVSVDYFAHNIHGYKELYGCTAPVDANFTANLWLTDPSGGSWTLIATDNTSVRCQVVTTCYVAAGQTSLPAGTYFIEIYGYWTSPTGDPPGAYTWPHEGEYITLSGGPQAPVKR